ncbi:MAG: hypothetical protein Q4F29_04195 [Lachnospiraceae bacterium]|nr:hypothetical protein [Lachnospiraceae bacterium]
MERFRRPLAVICLILMGILILAALILAIIGTEEALRLLMADLFCLMVVPAVFYGYQLLLNMKKKRMDENDD